MGDDEIEKLKLEINNLIWMHGPGDLKLEAAEERAVKILGMIRVEPSEDEK